MRTSPPELSEAQRSALALAEALRWQVWVEASDGQRLRLRHGQPDRVLVLQLAHPTDRRN